MWRHLSLSWPQVPLQRHISPISRLRSVSPITGWYEHELLDADPLSYKVCVCLRD